MWTCRWDRMNFRRSLGPRFIAIVLYVLVTVLPLPRWALFLFRSALQLLMYPPLSSDFSHSRHYFFSLSARFL